MMTLVPYWNWYGYPTDFTLAQIVENTVGWFLAGLVLRSFGPWLGMIAFSRLCRKISAVARHVRFRSAFRRYRGFSKETIPPFDRQQP
jgi:hypothetical protein